MLCTAWHSCRAAWTSTFGVKALSTSSTLLRAGKSVPRNRRGSSEVASQSTLKRAPPPFPARRGGNNASPSTQTKWDPISRGNGRFNHAAPSGSRASSSDITFVALLGRLELQLKSSWSTVDATISAIARDMGLDQKAFAHLSKRFAHDALRDLRENRAQLEEGVDGHHHAGEGASSSAIVWDLSRVKSSYIDDGPSSISNACLRMFVQWAHQQPLPPAVGWAAATPKEARDSELVANITLSKLHHLAEATDRRYPGEAYPAARARRRKLILHVGPTNSGKTHSALVALARSRTGAYAGPLRLLAHEVYARLNNGKIGQEGKVACNLLTGEEQRIVDIDAGLTSCTVEMFPMSKRLDVGVVDEIQMIGDVQRGTAWTNVVIGANCAELHLCGEESIVELVQRLAHELGDECVIKRYSRLSPLVVAEQSLGGDLAKIQRGDCLVTFSRSNIFAFKRLVEEKTGLKVAVAYGGLPPEVREEQARMFNEGAYDVLVASDAVGMGLNLKVRRIVFESLHKWDGKSEIQLPTPQIKQIAGRAGRFGLHTPTSPSGPDDSSVSASDVVGEATCLDEDDMASLNDAMATPTIKVERAVLETSQAAFQRVQVLLPAHTPFSKVFRLVQILSRTNTELYTIPSTRSASQVVDAIANIGPLSCEERLLFGNAPVNMRDANVVGALVHFVQEFAAGQPVMMERWAKTSGVGDALDLIEEARAAAKLGSLAPEPAATGVAAETVVTTYQASQARLLVYDSHFLMKLESFHRCLTLYLWLSYRQWSIFQDREAARALRKKVEAGIDLVLEGLKFERVSRPSKMKRNRARVTSMEGAARSDLFGMSGGTTEQSAHR
ncbi:BQ2448_76 [Microbotryum intermedium]|uniref:BQ2448_76 protein n=1 Tax=Microbotryum intermedium TaxID=269621 RepID=A0A238F4J7_9BASI|nr:BQ2448_76 [Microbotryum intermedium]